MSGVRKDGTRTEIDDSLIYHPVQSIVMRNKQEFRAGYTGESDLYGIDAAGTERRIAELKFVRDGSIRGYVIHDTINNRGLLKVHFHGNVNSPIDRMLKAFFRSPNPKWDVRNEGLFDHLPIGANLGLIREVFPDSRVFEPNEDLLPGVPRLEMQSAASLGQHYWLAVSGIHEPVGEVRSGLVGRIAARSEVYTTIVRNLSAEEAVLFFTMVVATDMKRQKSITAKNQAFGAFV